MMLEHLRRSIEQTRAAGQKVAGIPLADYRSPAEFMMLCGGTADDWRKHDDLTREAKERISSLYPEIPVVLVPMHAPLVLRWMGDNKLPNTPQNRTRYVAEHCGIT